MVAGFVSPLKWSCELPRFGIASEVGPTNNTGRTKFMWFDVDTILLSDANCQKLINIGMHFAINRQYFRGLFRSPRKTLPHSLWQTKARLANREAGLSPERNILVTGVVIRVDSAACFAQISVPLRFAIKAARFAPWAHGIAASSLAAVSLMELIKRLFVFLVFSSSISIGSFSIRCWDQYCASSRYEFGKDWKNAEYWRSLDMHCV